MKNALRHLFAINRRRLLAAKKRSASPFRLRDGAQHLGGLRLESWPEIRKVIYEGRGE